MSERDYDLFQQFFRLEWLLHRYHQENHREHGPMGDPHRGQGRVLALLKLKPEMSQKELSDILDMRPQSLGELLAKLERSGYITRTPSPADRRIMEIHLTDAGREASGQAEQTDTDELFACLSDEEQAALAEYLGRVIGTLEQRFSRSEPESGNRGRADFEARGFGRFRGETPPFDDREFGRRPGAGDRRPPFGGREFGQGVYDPRSPYGRGFDRRPDDEDPHTEK